MRSTSHGKSKHVLNMSAGNGIELAAMLKSTI
jgi:hypothetical protein